MLAIEQASHDDGCISFSGHKGINLLALTGCPSHFPLGLFGVVNPDVGAVLSATGWRWLTQWWCGPVVLHGMAIEDGIKVPIGTGSR